METLEKNIVTTLKAEIINEFEFIPHMLKKDRFSQEEYMAHPYTSDYKATVAVKIGNAVKNLTFKENNTYISIKYLEDGTHTPSLDLYWLGIDKNTNPFEELENVGIEVDYSEVLFQYQKMVEEAKYRETLMERLEIWKKIRIAKKELKESWIHNFEATIRADKNKKIKEAVKLTTFTPSTNIKENHHVDIEYKGVIVPIHKIAGSFVFNNEKYSYYSYLRPCDKETGNEVILEEGKLRRAKREGTIFLKAIEAIEIREKQIEYKREKHVKELKETVETKNHFEEILGHPVYVHNNRIYPGKNSFRTEAYDEKQYWLITEQPTSKYGSFKGIRLDRNTYNGIKYSINGKFDLREDQFKKIIEILLDGRLVHKKLIIPEDKD